MLQHFIDLFLHLDKHLVEIIQNYGAWTYAIVFLIIFCETGLVVTPFLPGDSLLFVLGVLAAHDGPLTLTWLLVLLTTAAILGDTVNYYIGHLLAPKIVSGQKIKFIKKEHLDRTHQFFEKYGGKAIILARFAPIIRTFAPFLAGAGSMTYGKFFFYNVVGAFLWVFSFVLGGYFFGNIPAVKKNFTLVIMAIIVLSLLPAVWEFIQHRRSNQSKPTPNN